MVSASSPKALEAAGKTPIRVLVVEKTDKEVSSCWKNCQILSYVIVIISSIAAAKSMGDIVAMFSDQCIFNATLATRVDELLVRWIYFDDRHYYNCRWGDVKDCDFSQFYPVASMAFSATLATFFTMCGRGGNPTRNLPQPWRVVPIAFLLNLIFVVTSCTHVKYVFDGFSSFCNNIVPLDNASYISSCDDLFKGQVYLGSSGSNSINLADNVIGAKVFSVMTLVGWVFGLLILMVRCATHADFNVLVERQTMSTPEKKAVTVTQSLPIKIQISQYHTPTVMEKSTV